MGLKFAILYEGKAITGKKTVKTMMDWPQSTVLKTLKKHFNVYQDLDKAFAATVKEFKKLSTKIP